MMKSKQYDSVVLLLALLIVLAGFYQMLTLKSALLPSIDKPLILLQTSWQGKGAEEIEQTLIAPLEQQLKSIPNLMQIKSSVSAGGAVTKLYFPFDTDMEKVYLEVLSQVNQVSSWPAQVSPPRVINQSSGANSTLASAMLYTHADIDMAYYSKVMTSIVEPELAKITGVARIDKAFNSTENRIDIEFDPEKLAQYTLSLDQVASALRNLKDQSGSQITLGARDYNLHFKGQLSIDELKNQSISVEQGHVIRLSEIANIRTQPQNKWGFASFQGRRAFYFTFEPAPDIDALATIAEIKQVFESLNSGPLKKHGMEISLSRDDSKSIHAALEQVYSNLLLGVILACALLFFFFRSISAIVLIFLTVPLCLAIVILGMKLGDFSLNVISLAGMALSIGLLLDASIIVIDNIYHHLERGKPLIAAVSDGVKEVRGAIISSTLSSIIVFVPILMMSSPEAQLFIDLAFTISSALAASVLVSLVVLPVVSRKLMADTVAKNCDALPSKVIRWFTAPARNIVFKTALLLFGIPGALLLSYVLAPEFDVLPNPNQNSVNAIVIFNEPLSHQAVQERVSQVVFERIKASKNDPQAPEYDIYGMFCNTAMCQLYFYPPESWNFQHFKSWIEEDLLSDLPGTVNYVSQGKLLSFALPDSRVIELHLKGDTLDQLQKAGRDMLDHLTVKFPDAKITEDSPLYNKVSRIEVTPKQQELVHLGLTPAQLNDKLVALTDGLYLGHFYSDGKALPLYLKGKNIESIEQLMNSQLVLPGYGNVQLSQLADISMTLAPSELLRVDGVTTVALEIEPPEGVSIGEFLKEIKQEINSYVAGYQNKNIYFGYMGSADNLQIFLKEFSNLLIISLLTLSVLMWLTLRSWRLAGAVMLSLPLAIFGGMLNLRLIDLFDSQNLDIITMIGFIILLGLVINNAILLATQFQQGLAKGLTQIKAIEAAIIARSRPIYISTGTSILGMLPLMLSPDEVSEIYRGLAAVIVGGMTISALLCLSFMSALLSLPVFAKPVGRQAGGTQSQDVDQMLSS